MKLGFVYFYYYLFTNDLKTQQNQYKAYLQFSFLSNCEYSIKVKVTEIIFYEDKRPSTKTVMLQNWCFFHATLNCMFQYTVYSVFANMQVSLRIMGISVLTLKVLLCFLLKDGPACKSAYDIYPSSVNNQGEESRGCIFWWCWSHYINDLSTHLHSGEKPCCNWHSS